MKIYKYVNHITKTGKGSLTLQINNYHVRGGEISIKGFKHSLVQIICISIAYNIKIKIRNVPNVIDVHVFCKIIKKLGGKAQFLNSTLIIDPRKIYCSEIPVDLSSLIHGSLYLMPALLIRCGRFNFKASGGCQIGENGGRPTNHILRMMQRYGAKIIEGDEIFGELNVVSEIRKIDILEFSTSRSRLEGPLVGGATKVAIMFSLKQNYVEIVNPYLKSDVLDVLRFIKILNKDVIIKGDKLIIKNKIITTEKYVNFELMPCVSELMTYIAFSVTNQVPICIQMSNTMNLKNGLMYELELLKRMNVGINLKKNKMNVMPHPSINSQIISVLPETIQSDHHPFFALMLMMANKDSRIIEEVWKSRFGYVENLQTLGINMASNLNEVVIKPYKECGHLKNNINLDAKDVRTAAVTILGGIATHSSVSINHIEHLFRGYDSILKNLKKLGIKFNLKENKNESPFNS